MRAVQPLALALVVISALLIGSSGVWHSVAATTPIERCLDSDAREHVRAILLAGLDQGLKEHTVQTFDTWMKDTTEQPQRAIAGMQRAISAHVRSRAAAKKWNPPSCPVMP